MSKTSGMNAILARLLECSMDAALVVEQSGRILFANPALEALTGWSHDELVGASLDILLPLALRPKHSGWVTAFVHHGGPSQVLGHRREMTLCTKDGTEIPIELKAVDLGRDGKRHFLGAFMQDLRPRKILEGEQARLFNHLQVQALNDSLTGLPNRRAFDGEVRRVLGRVRRSGQKTVVAIFDIDHFKDVNDRHGHAVGDRVLQMIGQKAPTILRAGDFIARYGGEEFALLLPDTTIEQAIPVVERLREIIAAAETKIDKAAAIKVTVSVGLSSLEPNASFDLAWKHADEAMYQAKEAGRNCTKIYEAK
jgi:diguanylate cyclase (GGDEF)-like protein/PAS domain S-box-containing protein